MVSQVFQNTQSWHYYRPQRSWGKVMFLQPSVILLTGGSASVHAGIPPPWDQAPTPPEETPLEETPRRRPPRRRPSQRRPPRGDPPGGDPLGGDTPQYRACWEIWSTRGQYASYWNAILLVFSCCLKWRIRRDRYQWHHSYFSISLTNSNLQ